MTIPYHLWIQHSSSANTVFALDPSNSATKMLWCTFLFLHEIVVCGFSLEVFLLFFLLSLLLLLLLFLKKNQHNWRYKTKNGSVNV